MAADPLPPLFTRAEARSCGLTDRQLDRGLASGRLQAVRRGLLRRTDGPDPDDDLAAFRTVGGSSAVLSHCSAARRYGLPGPLGGWGEATLTTDSGTGRLRNGVRLVVAPLSEADVVTRSGLTLTSPARTVADCLRTLPPVDGLAMADAALHRHLITGPDLERALAGQTRWPGARKARQLLALTDGRRESPLESWSAWALDQEGVPAPVWQVDLLDLGGRFAGRTDLWWPDGVAGESDGRLKYLLGAAERGGATADALAAIVADEHRRARAITDLGVDLRRWGAGDVLRPAPRHDLGLHLRESLLSAARRRSFRGRTRLRPY